MPREQQGLEGRLDTLIWDLSLLPQDTLTFMPVLKLIANSQGWRGGRYMLPAWAILSAQDLKV